MRAMNRKRVALIGGVVLSLLGLVGVILWFTLHTRVRTWMWDRTAGQPLEDGEAAELARCASPSWAAWLKVSTLDPDIVCGEAWVVAQLAEKLGSADRARWIDLRVADPATPPGFRMRGAMALLVAGWGTSAEPAWLAEQLTSWDRCGPGGRGGGPSRASRGGGAGSCSRTRSARHRAIRAIVRASGRRSSSGG
jgi:hypothetical protein